MEAGQGLEHMEQTKSIDDVLHYLKTVLEGSNKIHLNVWLKLNQNALSSILPRGEYLRLKHTPLEFARKGLQKKSISFVENKSRSRYEEYLMTFSDAALTKDGDIKRDWFGRIFGGILMGYFSGDFLEFKKDVYRFLQKKQGNSLILTEDVIDLLYFAETTFVHDRKLSVVIINLMADFFKEKEISIVEIENSKKIFDI